MDEHRDPDANAASPPGLSIGRFQARRLLGQGGMGVVHLAFDPLLRRDVALKVLRPELLGSAAARGRFEREAMAATRLQHPGLCPVYEIGEAEGQPFLVMPYLEGETLAIRFARDSAGGRGGHRQRIDEVVAIVERVARALHHAHEAGLIHRDVKPGNILIRGDGTPIVLDFGLVCDAAGAVEVRSRSVETRGTPLYMAPEQILHGAAQADARTDVYALGVTLFEGLTLHPPFSGRTLHELFEQIRGQPTPNPAARNKRVSRDLQVIVEVATDKDPRRRYATCLELADDLQRCRHGEPILARPAPRALRLRRWLRRNPASATLIAVLSIGMLTTSSMWLANASLAERLAARASSEVRQRREAARLQTMVTERSQRFDLLATKVQLAGFEAEAGSLRHAWPPDAAALQAWSSRFETQMRPQLHKVEAALDELARQDGGTDVDATASPAGDDSLQTLLAQVRQRLASLRAAAAVRQDDVGSALPASRTAAAMPMQQVLNMVAASAMRECGPDRPLGCYGQEQDFLDLTTRALTSEPDRMRPAFLVLHAWALFATGHDQRSSTVMQQAVELAPVGLRTDLAWELQRLARAQQDTAADLAATEAVVERLEQLLAAQRQRPLPEAADQVLFAELHGVRFEAFRLTRPGGLAERIEQRRRWALALPELTGHHPDAPVSWAAAAAAIAAADGIQASELYREVRIELKPQLGLVPIGKNPVTGLWEFYHLRSALETPDADAARRLAIPRHRSDGSIDMGAGTGIVFVLVPGGATTIGSQRIDPHGANYDPDSRADEPLMTGVVAPCFLARHELTQGQWQRLDDGTDILGAHDANPSSYRHGVIVQGQWISPRHPVETVSWTECGAHLAPHGLRLPTEWEWERACRAGSPQPYSTGPDAASLAGHENMLDLATRRIASWKGTRVPFDDGYVLHAPVGSFAANRFGMFDMHGNLAEFCSDRFSPLDDMITARGGRFSEAAVGARSAARVSTSASGHSFGFGLRACRDLR